MASGITKYDDDSASYVVNEADYDAALKALDDGARDIMKELRRETIPIFEKVPYLGAPRFIRNGETV